MSGETPRALGFRMPAEWEPHEGTWIAWPHNEDDWPGRFEPIPWVYGEIVRKLAGVERVHILVRDEELRESARAVLQKCGANLAAVDFILRATDRVWTRDFAPQFLKNAAGETAAVKFRFNGWAKYNNYLLDDAAGRAIPGVRWEPDTVLEGGSIDVNGAGLLLTTEECLLSPVQARNPGLSRDALETYFREYLGIGRVLWLGNGIVGDDTHGHIDDLARFTSADSIVMVSEDDPADPNYAPLAENWARVQSMPLHARRLPMPAPVWFDGVRLPASYANFYIANRTVLVPTFNDPNDRIALNTMAECFPDRTVTGINCVELVWGLGTLHCMTQQQPA
ncbi:MAG TPA: agmatine deiminase family protein [Bryobacteraceae bacterium]|nr:agmatine deiminase family protein [Bryobacteraceae bacterium]